ncbi:YLS9 protein [Spatholobus suberectus]|nr:YLS9 protein [Spatholobus suberectus]
MTDRVHPSAKPTANGGPKPTFPATKSQLSSANRPAYRPQPPQHRRGCACTLCCYLLLILFFLLLLAGGAGTVLYFLYRPHRPTFSVTSLKLSSLNLTTLSAKFDLTLSTTNPNDKILFSYDPTSVSVLSGDAHLAAATIPSFLHRQRNTTVLEASLESAEGAAESDAATQLKSSMRSKSEVALKVMLDTKVAAQMGAFRTPRVGIRVSCDGVAVSLPDGDKPATASAENTECEVDVRFKVWKWTLG